MRANFTPLASLTVSARGLALRGGAAASAGQHHGEAFVGSLPGQIGRGERGLDPLRRRALIRSARVSQRGRPILGAGPIAARMAAGIASANREIVRKIRAVHAHGLQKSRRGRCRPAPCCGGEMRPLDVAQILAGEVLGALRDHQLGIAEIAQDRTHRLAEGLCRPRPPRP